MKLGTLIKIMTKVEIIWSVILFFFKAAHIPIAIPVGTLIKTEIILMLIDVGKRAAIILIALLFTKMLVEQHINGKLFIKKDGELSIFQLELPYSPPPHRFLGGEYFYR